MVLDAARYLAAAIVVLYHAIGTFDRPLFLALTERFPTHLGALGLATFFLLSGFLVTGSALRNRAEDPTYGMQAYLRDRAARIYVVLVPALLAGAAFAGLVYAFEREPPTALTLRLFLLTLSMLLGVQGITDGREAFVYMDPTWSINYEVLLYVALGAVALEVSGFSSKASRLARLAVAFGVGLLAVRLPDFAYYGAVWATGSVVAHVHARGFRTPWARTILAASTVTFVATGFIAFGPGRWIGTLALAGIGISALALTERTTPPPGLARPAAFLAGFSYSLYVIHFGVIIATQRIAAHHGLVGDGTVPTGAGFVLLVLTVVMSHVVAWGFSIPTERSTNAVRRALRGFARPTSPARPAR